MNEKVLYMASAGLTALALLFLVVNVLLIGSNRSMQQNVMARQATINNGTTLSQLNQNLVQALAQASVKNDDQEIRSLLKEQGITINANNGKADDVAKSKDDSAKAKE
jgi:hypothetical protein